MSYLLNGLNLFDTYTICASHAPGSNIAMAGCFDMPKRIGTTFKDWGDMNGIEPWVNIGEIMFAGRDIEFTGFITGPITTLNTYLDTLYTDIGGFTGLVELATPYITSNVYVKSVIPEYLNGGCKLKMTFREPVVTLTGSLSASGAGTYTIDSIPFSSFGLYLSKADKVHDLPENKEQFFTKYGQEGYQIVKRKNKMLDIDGFITGTSLTDFTNKVKSLYKIFSSPGTRSVVLNTVTTVNCFATEGFKVDRIHYSDSCVIAKFHMELTISTSANIVPPAEYPAVLDDGNTKFWYDPTDLLTITKDGNDLVSEWRDKLGSGNDLVQADGSRQPLWTSSTILFDGIDNSMKTGVFNFVQPEFIYMIVKVVTWTLNNRIFDGNTNNAGVLYEASTTPGLKAYAGINSAQDDGLAVDTWGIVRVYFNEASSKLIIDDNTPTTWNCGTASMGAFALARIGAGLNYGNIQVKDIIGRSSALGESEIYAWLVTRL